MQKASTPTYRYADVEAALAGVHGIPAKSMGAFKGRLIHLQRIGVAPSSPGRGKRIAYDLKDVCRLGLCLQLAEFGIDPTRVAAIVTMVWPLVEPPLLHETEGEDDIYTAVPAILTREVVDRVHGRDTAQGGLFPGPNGTICKASEIGTTRDRLITINLSELRRRIVRHLPAAPA